MASRQEIRILARLPDGSLRCAVRYSDKPGWMWVYEGRSKLRLLGDIIVSLDTLPDSAEAFAASLGFSLVP